MANGAGDGGNRRLTFLEKFITRFYESQPRWVRTVVYLMFAVIVVYGAYKTIGGQVVLNGQILEPNSEGIVTGAFGYEVMVGDTAIGTNSKGMFYLPLSPPSFALVLASGELEVDIYQGMAVVQLNVVMNYQYTTMPDLDPYSLGPSLEGPAEEDMGLGGMPLDRPANPAAAIGLINRAVAAEQTPADRLFVRTVRPASGESKLVPLSLNLQLDGDRIPLKSTKRQSEGTVSLEVPVGQNWAPETIYYFDLPPDVEAADLLVNAQYGFFSKFEEAIKFQIPRAAGEVAQIEGTAETVITLQRLSAYDVVIFDKKDIFQIKEDLKSELTKQGFRVLEYKSPLGYAGQTNAVYGGRDVPLDSVQLVLQSLSSHGVDIKRIARNVNLRSGNPYEIQIGGSRRLDTKPPIPAGEIERLFDAEDIDSFDRILSNHQG